MTKKELLQKCEDLGIETATEALTNAALKELIDAKEAEINDIDVDADDESPAPKKPKEKSKPVYTDKRGIQWQFTDFAPKTINIDGRPMTQAEIFEAEDVVSELVFGGSNFLTQKQ